MIPICPLSQAFWDATGGLWAAGKLAGKYVGLFVSTGTQGGGQESTAIAMMSTFAHHGLIYVPLGYSRTFPQFANYTEVHGGKQSLPLSSSWSLLLNRSCRQPLGCWDICWS
jgi:multimeric flavodoxin WrbA